MLHSVNYSCSNFLLDIIWSVKVAQALSLMIVGFCFFFLSQESFSGQA